MLVTASTLPHAAPERKRLARLHHNHTEIDVRYAWLARHNLGDARERFPRGSPALLCRVRLRELEALYDRRYGRFLPYDDAGIDDLKIAAHHIAHMRGDALGHIVDWAGTWMPDLPHERAEALARDVVDEPVKFKAATLAWRLRLTEEERTALASPPSGPSA